MTTSADEQAIDLHAIRHGMKLKRDTGPTKLFENRKGIHCPVCDEPFVTLYASEKRQNRFAPDAARPFCVIRERDRIVILTHE